MKSTLLIFSILIIWINSIAFSRTDSLDISVWKLAIPADRVGELPAFDNPLHKGGFLVYTSSGLSLGSDRYFNFANNELSSDSKKSSFNLDLQGGRFFSRAFVLGGYVGVTSSSRNIIDYYKIKSFLIKLGPYARIYIPLKGKIQPFADFEVAVGFGSEKQKYDNPDINTTQGLGYFGLGVGLGASVFLSDRFALDFKFAFDIDSNATADETYSTASVKQFVGVKTGFNFILN